MKKTLCLLLALVLTLSALGLTACKKEDASAAHTFTLEVTDLEGKVTKHEISTDKKTVGEALLEQGRVVERGNHNDLLDLCGRYYQLYTNMIELA